MFYVIEPQEHHFYQATITQFVKDLQNATIISDRHDLPKATFLLVAEEIEGIFGGLFLLKQSIHLAPPEIRERLRDYYPHLQDLWTGAILFQMDETLPGHAFEKACKALYRNLYEDLIIFSIKESAPLLCLTMPLIEHLSIELLGLWPCLLDVRSTSSHGLFHKVIQPLGTLQEVGPMCKYDKGVRDSREFHLVSAKNCNKIATLSKKIKPVFCS